MSSLLTIRDVAEKLGFAEITIRRMAIDGRIPSLKLGKSRRFDPEIIDNIVKSGRLPVAGASR